MKLYALHRVSVFPVEVLLSSVLLLQTGTKSSCCYSGIHHYTATEKFFISIPFIFCRIAKIRRIVMLHLVFLKHVLFGALLVLWRGISDCSSFHLWAGLFMFLLFWEMAFILHSRRVLFLNKLLIRGFRLHSQILFKKESWLTMTLALQVPVSSSHKKGFISQINVPCLACLIQNAWLANGKYRNKIAF